MLTQQQLRTLIALVNEERQFWNSDEQDDAAQHHRDDASLDQLERALERLKILHAADLANAADIVERAAAFSQHIQLCHQDEYHTLAQRLRHAAAR